MEKGGCVYMMSNSYNTVVYVGVTSDLVSRVIQHKEKMYPKSFTAKYNCSKLVYYNCYHTIEEAKAEELRIKGGNRARKNEMINSMNESWSDLLEVIKNW